MNIKLLKQEIALTLSTALMLLAAAGIAQPPPPPNEYCIPTYTNVACAANSQDYIDDFSTTGGLTNISNFNSGCSNPDGNPNWYYYAGNTLTVNPGQTFNFEVGITPNFSQGVKIWIDYNIDGIFDDTELIFTSVNTAGNPGAIPAGGTQSGTATVPLTATEGLARMRVRCVFNTIAFQSCENAAWGETEDYDVNILPLTPCVSPPVAGIALSNNVSLCSGQNFNLSLTGNSFGSGQTFQWQISTNDVDFVDIAGANSSFLTTNQTATNYYRCAVTCDGQTTFSASVLVENQNCFLMDNTVATTCDGIFYDSGGPTGNYTNNQNFSMTFFPATPGQMLQFNFNEFTVENNFDFLTVHNGVDVSAPVLGIFTGPNAPGVITAANADGALTFVFTSDGSGTPAGWNADISCIAPIVNEASVEIAYTYGKIPVDYGANHQISAIVRNNNSLAEMTIPVTLNITGANTFTNTQTITLAAQESGTVTFAGFSPTNPGTQLVSVSVPSDTDPSNNSFEIEQTASSNAFSYKYNNETNEPVGVGLSGITGQFVSKFTTAIPGSINSVKVDFTVQDAPYRIGIWEADNVNGTPGALLYESADLTTNIGTDFITVNPPVAVPAGDFYVGVIQTSNTNVGFAWQTESPIRVGTFQYAIPQGSTTWLDVANIPQVFRFAMEIEMALPIPPNCAVYNAPLNQATGICLNQGTISWASGGLAPTSYDVFFGTTPDLTGVTPVNVTTTSYNPGILLPNTTYYWRIVPLNEFGPATGCEIFSFTTGTCTVITMDNQTVTTCDAQFFDSNQNGDYANNENFTTTFLPSTTGAFVRVEFLSFATENNFDGLMIYDGPDINSPLISSGLAAGFNAVTCPEGSWRGTGSPGIITASNPTGALTFVFRSEGSVTAAGWEANVTCVTTPPECAIITSPVNGATDICLNSGAISWINPGATAGFTVLFSTNPDLSGATPVNVNINSFFPGTLEPNTTYYYQVTPFNNFGAASNCPIQSFTTGTCNSCNYAIRMTDDFGDGWNGGTVNVFSNGVEVAGSPFTLATGAGPLTVEFPINEGEEITTTFNAGGFPTEVSYEILNSFGQVIFSDGGGVAPQAGPNVVGNASCLPITNDAEVVILYTLGKLPIGFGTPHTAKALVRNNNTFNTMTIPVTLNVSGANTYTSTVNVTLNAGQSLVVDLPGFDPTVAGSNTMTVSVPDDQDNDNNIQTVEMLTTPNVYTYKYPAIANEPFGVGFTGATGNFVAKFNSNGTNPINQINVDFTAGGQQYNLGIWDATGPNGAPGTLIGEVTGLTSLVGTAFVTVNPPITVTGDFYVGVRQTGTTNIAFAYQPENPIRNQTFYYSTPIGSTNWIDFAPVSQFRFAIEVEIAQAVPPNCAINLAPADQTTGICLNQANLTWASGGLAPTSYNVYINTTPDFTGVTPVNVTGLSYNPGVLLPNTTYYWQVIPQNDNGTAAGCQTLSFTTGDCLEYLQTNGSFVTCSGTYFDSAGPNSNYLNNENSTMTFTSSVPGNLMQVTFDSFQIENNFDFMSIFDAPTADPNFLIGTFTGPNNPGTITSGGLNPGNSSLTFVFTSDDIVTQAGWSASINCVDPNAAPGCVVNTLPADGSIDVPVATSISWTPGPGTIPTSYNVFFGPQGNLTLVSAGQTGTSYTPTSILDISTTYCYQIIAINANGEATNCATSCFTTAPFVEIPISNGQVTTCEGVFTDAGGLASNYQNNEEFTFTIFPATANSLINVNFTQFDTENGFDGLMIYNGPVVDDLELISSGLAAGFNAVTCPAGSWRGTGSPGSITSTHATGALTFVFRSEGSVTRPGWAADISCIDASAPPVCVINTSPAEGAVDVPVVSPITWSPGIGAPPTSYNVFFGPQGNLTLVSQGQTSNSFIPSTPLAINTTYCYQIVAINANGESTNCETYCFTTAPFVEIPITNGQITTCEGVFTDAGGLANDYQNNENYTFTIFPATPNSALNVNFTAFETENNFDGMMIYDGPDINSPLISSGLAAGTNAVTCPEGSWRGTGSPGSITSTHPTGALTFVFRSDGSVTDPGWAADITCVPTGGCQNPVITVSGGSNQVCAGATVTLTASSTNNTWSTGETGTSITVTVNQVTTITVTDNDCQLSSTIDLTPVIVTSPTIVSNTGNSICPGSTILLSASLGGLPIPPGQFTYLWSNGSTTPVAQITAPGCYTLTVTNALGCSATSAEFCLVPGNVEVPTIQGVNTICAGNTVTLTASSNNTQPTYSWSNGTTGETTQITQPGCYTVTVNANGCTATSLEFCVTPAQIEIPVITGNSSICAGNPTTLTAASNNPNAVYTWSNGATGSETSVSQEGCYTVTVNSNGCTAISTEFCLNVTSAPTITVDGATSFCEGGSVFLTASQSQGSYLWSNQATTQTITVTQSGSYTVTTTVNGCTLTSLPVQVNVTQVQIPVITPSATNICDNNCVTLTSSTAANYISYQWSGGAPNQNTSLICTPGVYTVTVTTAEGCSATSASVTISSGTAFTPTITVGGNNVICEGQNVILLSSSNTNNQWLFNGVPLAGANGVSHSATQTGNYAVVVSQNGCTGTSPNIPVVVNELPTAAGGVASINNALVTFVNNSSDFIASQWNFGDGSALNNTFNPTHEYLANGIYTVTLTVWNECGSSTITFTVEITQVGINNIAGLDGLNVYPNPTSGMLFVNYDNNSTKTLRVTLLNVAGQEILSENINNFNGNYKQNFDISNLAAGVYMLQIVTDGQSYTTKVIRD